MGTRSPEILLARQAIVDRQGTVVAYELLHRSGDQTTAMFIDDALATRNVVNAAFNRIGINAVAGEARVLVNVNAEFLMSRSVEQLPPERVMLEILETVEIDDQIVQRCRALKQKGYRLALDDVTRYSKTLEPLLEFVDLVKIDVMQLDAAELERLVKQLKPWHARLLAEKVETIERAKECLRLGMDWFQGFFFSRPAVLAA